MCTSHVCWRQMARSEKQRVKITAETWKQEAVEVDLCHCLQGVSMFIMFQ